MPDSELIPPVREDLFVDDGSAPSLVVGRCRSCSAATFPRAALCDVCQSDDVESWLIGGRGHLYTFTVVRARPPAYNGPVPYAIGLIELPEKLRVAALILAHDYEQLQVGDEMDLFVTELGTEDGSARTYAYRPQAESVVDR